MTEGEYIDVERKQRLLSEPVNQLRLTPETTVAELVDSFSTMSIQARNMGTAAKIWERMLADELEPTIFLGLSGPLIAAGLRNVIRDMVANGHVDVVVSTGAVIYQDYLYARGGNHCIAREHASDGDLHDMRINRIFDVYTDDEFFEEMDSRIADIAEGMDPGNYSSREFVLKMAADVEDEDSIIHACAKAGVPIFVPAINDSSIGIGLTRQWARGIDKMSIDSIKDNYEIVQTIVNSRCSGGIYIGGGVPKNYINDAIVMANLNFGATQEGHKYAIQVSTATSADGGLSGSTLSEAVAWGKIRNEATRAMVFSEVSLGLPLLYGYVLGKDPGRFRKPKRLNGLLDNLE